jgi:hypothetical protein
MDQLKKYGELGKRRNGSTEKYGELGKRRNGSTEKVCVIVSVYLSKKQNKNKIQTNKQTNKQKQTKQSIFFYRESFYYIYIYIPISHPPYS